MAGADTVGLRIFSSSTFFDMNRILKDLIKLLNLETLDDNLFRGESRDLGGKSMFGGQVVGQALVAASRTIADPRIMPHSLHAYFLRPGDMNKAVIYEVDRVRDGRSFMTRRVQAIQGGQVILSMMTSFHSDEPGFDHQAPMPKLADPEQLRLESTYFEQWLSEVPEVSDRVHHALTREIAIEFKPVNPCNPLCPQASPPQQAIWFRCGSKLPDDPILHNCVLAYASDFNLLTTAMRPHARSWFDEHMLTASVDHSLWFHRHARADQWLLYVMDSPTAQSARGLSRGLIYDRSGRLVASVVQESLMRDITLRPAR